jgi:hypothetical protein
VIREQEVLVIQDNISPKIAAIIIALMVVLPLVWLGIRGLWTQSTIHLLAMKKVYGQEARVQGTIYLVVATLIVLTFLIILATGNFNPRWE